MNSKERFLSAMEYKGYDRPPSHHYGTPEINQELMETLRISDYESLMLKLGDDLRHVAPRYAGPELRVFPDGSWEGLWGERYTNYDFGKGTYPEACYLPFEKVTEVEDLKNFRMPSADWFDYSHIKEDCERNKDYVIYIEGAGTPDFMNSIARCRGVTQVLYDVGTEDPVYLELCKQRFEFFYEAIERTLQAADGLVDVVCLGEDLGNQGGIMISPAKYDKLFAPYMKELFALAHKYNARVMMHSCGSVRDLLPRLIDLGLDILEVVQVDAAKMDIRELHRDFYKKVAFCGSISVQSTLPFGTREDVVREVNLRKELFHDGGMIIAPTHAIQVGTPVENILAMYAAIGSLSPECV
jgi:uroporphyrinogen decarboxylase